MDNNPQIILRQATSADLDTITSILNREHLPAQDCHAHLDTFTILEVAGTAAGIGGLECYGEYGLLRSLVVLERYRGKGLGATIIHHIIEQACSQGIHTLYCLTEDAQQFLSGTGFSIWSRDAAPKPIRQTQQFSSLCPDSAVLMSLDISKD